METTKPLGHTINSQYIHEELLQGLQGSIVIPELLLQKIWAQKNFFFHKLQTYSKKNLEIIQPGYWNKFEGPDFKNAEIILNGQKITGDIEIHFHPNDWFSHNHHLNPNFSNVILHVTLFEPTPNHPPVFNTLGFCPETLVLLPYLKQSLEEYILEDALLDLENRNNTDFIQAFLDQSPFEIQQRLFHKAQLRWQQKLTFARTRIQQDGFTYSAHQMALETLGYRRNRSPMNTIAVNYPLDTLAHNPPSPEELFSSQKDNWKLAKLRPANHPLKRLQQYINLIKHNPNWPTLWLNYVKQFRLLPFSSGSNTSSYRKSINLSQLQSIIKQTILANSVSGTRFHTLLIDALLPLASAQLNKDLFNLWFHWHPGDIPSTISSFLAPTNLINKNQPSCNGLNQAVLQLFIETHSL